MVEPLAPVSDVIHFDSIQRESRNNQSYVANSTHVGIGFFSIFAPEELKQHVEEMKSQYSRKTTVEIGVTFARRFKRTLKPSRLDIFVIKQSNTLYKDQ